MQLILIFPWTLEPDIQLRAILDEKARLAILERLVLLMTRATDLSKGCGGSRQWLAARSRLRTASATHSLVSASQHSLGLRAIANQPAGNKRSPYSECTMTRSCGVGTGWPRIRLGR